MKPKNKRQLLISYALFFILGTIITIWMILQTPSESSNNTLFGLSTGRLGLMLLLVIPIIFFLGILIKSITDPASVENIWLAIFSNPTYRRLGVFISTLGMLLGWTGVLLPFYWMEQFINYLVRLQPIIVWMAVISTLTFVIYLWEHYRFNVQSVKAVLAPYSITLKVAGLALLLFAFIYLFISVSGIGIRTTEDYWYGAGVPLLASQVLFSLVVGALIWKFWPEKNSRFDWLIFLVIWLIAGLLWSQTPLQRSFFLPGPYPPNHEYYPFSDATLFDLAGQFAQIGQGILNGQVFDRALYMGFLIFLHALAGQNFEQVLALQAGIFAVFPALAYLLGKSLHGRALGITVAILAALRGVNAISANGLIDTAGPKMLLTDFPTALGIIGLVVLLVAFVKRPAEKFHYLLWIGGILGLTIMLRTNALALLPFILLLVFIRVNISWRRKLLGAALIILAMVTTTTPWDLRNVSRGAPMFSVYILRIQLVLKERYVLPPAPAPTVPSSLNTPLSGLTPVVAGLPIVGGGLIDVSILEAKYCSSLPCSILSHFLHNIVTSVLSLPTSPVLHELRYAIKQAAPFWQLGWTGNMDVFTGFFIALNLALIALGVGVAWERNKLAGLIPLYIFFAYDLSNALARTSGGRYIVPMDWVLYLYFAIGAYQVIVWVSALFTRRALPVDTAVSETQKAAGPQVYQYIFILLFLFAVGSLLPLSEKIYPRLYTSTSPAERLKIVEKTGLLDQSTLQPQPLADFLKDPQARVMEGRILYPRFYKTGRGETNVDYPYLFQNYPRTAFMLIGPDGQNGVIFPEDAPGDIPQASHAIIIGCEMHQAPTVVQAFAVVLLDQENKVYFRSPSAPLHCPLPDPICVNNSTCY
jgi:hypothetical protein